MRALLAAHGEAPLEPGGEDAAGPYLRHLVDHHRALVTIEADQVVAFGAAVDTGRCRMLSDLFVRPDRLGQGIGRTLLAALLGDGERLATFSSADPRALPSYVRAGMTPRWVNLYLQGLPRDLRDPGAAVSVRPAVPAELAALEARWLGAPRASDHAFWATQTGADPFLVEDDGRPVAFGYARARSSSPARALDRLVVAPAVDPVTPSVAGIVRAGRGRGVQVCVPGPHPVLPILLEAGFRIVDQDQFLASHPDIVDPVRLLPNPGLL
jgi:GNAT superfamily N-acetyltransferase